MLFAVQIALGECKCFGGNRDQNSNRAGCNKMAGTKTMVHFRTQSSELITFHQVHFANSENAVVLHYVTLQRQQFNLLHISAVIICFYSLI